VTDWKCEFEEIPVGKGRKLRDGSDVAVLSLGPIGVEVSKAIELVESRAGQPEWPHVSVAHYDMRFLKPLDEDILLEVCAKFKHVITVEDGVKKGGLGSAVAEFMTEAAKPVDVHCIGIEDNFIEHGSVSELYALTGLSAEDIAQTIVSVMDNRTISVVPAHKNA
jgi:1-deoxy-D-xylulose-5-phosphate synthase